LEIGDWILKIKIADCRSKIGGRWECKKLEMENYNWRLRIGDWRLEIGDGSLEMGDRRLEMGD